MGQQQVIPIQSAKKRVIGTAKFEESSIITMKLPTDTVIVGLLIRLSGSVQTTFASGTPVAKAEGTMEALINRIDVQVDGSRTVKSVTPHWLHMQNLFNTGMQTERFASAGAAPATDNFPTTEGTFVFGTTTQYTTVRESVYLPFEMIYCEPGMGREQTYLNLKRAGSAEIRFTTAAFLNLLGFGNTAPVTFANSTLQLEVTAIERQDLGNMVFDDWKQVIRRVPVGAESRDLLFEVSPGNYLTGIGLFCRDGAAGSATTATGKLASNLLIVNGEIKMNGGTTVQRASFKGLQSINKIEYGVNAPFAAGVSRLDGVAHFNLLSRRDLKTAFPNFKPVCDQLHLSIDSNAAGNVSYTNPAEILIVQEEWVKLV